MESFLSFALPLPGKFKVSLDCVAPTRSSLYRIMSFYYSCSLRLKNYIWIFLIISHTILTQGKFVNNFLRIIFSKKQIRGVRVEPALW